MIRLMRFKHGGFYFLRDERGSNDIVFSLWVNDIDPDGEYVELEIKESDNNRIITLSDEADIYDGVYVRLDEIYMYKDRLSVSLKFETELRVIRHEILYKEELKKIGGKQKNNR